jgi:hypothetical protein
LHFPLPLSFFSFSILPGFFVTFPSFFLTLVTVINKKKSDLNQTIEKTEKTAKNMITMMRIVNLPEEVIAKSLEKVRDHTESQKRKLVKWTEHKGRIGEVRALEQTKYFSLFLSGACFLLTFAQNLLYFCFF